jgi:predicted dehydrogenase
MMLRVLVVGVGSIGERHTRCFLSTGRAEVGVCELSDVNREAVAGRYDVCGAYDSLEAALAESWDVAVVATPAHTHIPIARSLARAGLHLLIEKPLSTSMDGVDDLQSEVAKGALVAGVGYTRRAQGLLQSMKTALDEERFGRPLQMSIHCGQSFAAYRPAYRDIYFADHAQGGGAIQDALTHLLNLGEWLVGPIDRITVDAAHQQLEGVTVEDTVHAMARQGDVLANYAVNLYQQPNEFIVTIVCERATVRCEVHKNRWRWMTETDGPWHEESIETPTRDSMYENQANNFLDVVEGKGKPLCTLEEGVQTLAVNLAALASMKEGNWQAIQERIPKGHRTL